ncbi:MAG: iron-containing alcohol dehydrogenase [Candidatus Rokubacteria bacterium]|nr:iron-containing alcohol dehydrogenase [Candidatus Rokubacteria bacterium]
MSGRAFVNLPTDRVIYGAGTLVDLAPELDRLGLRRAFVITGETIATKTTLLERAKYVLGPRFAGAYTRAGQHVPRTRVLEAARAAAAARTDVLVSLGGGSPIDSAKAAAFAIAEKLEQPDDFNRYSTRWPPPGGARVPFTASTPPAHIAIPTTLSAGEHTPNAGQTDETRRRKDGISHPLLAPKVVILDPEVTRDTPPPLWASTGMRAFDHAVERFCSPHHQPITDPLCLEAIRRLVRRLPASTRDAEDMDARLACLIAAWLSIHGAFNAPTGLSHAIGHQLGGRCGVPHGITSCITLARVMAFNAPAVPERMAAIAEAMGTGSAPAGVADLVQALGLPSRLSETGKVSEDDLEPIARQTFEELRPGLNPRPVESATQILAILKDAW